ncbi:hypothetical protein VPH35_020672 [Triticum aestivum]
MSSTTAIRYSIGSISNLAELLKVASSYHKQILLHALAKTRGIMATRSPMSQEEPEERQIGIDPFSLRQLSRLDIDKPLPIPSVSVDDHHRPAYSPARSASASVPCSGAASPRLSSAATAPTRWDAHLALARLATSSVADTTCPSRDASRSYEFDVILSSPERRASAPQRWGSDVPLIGDARGKDGRRRGKHGSEGAPFSCCLYLPGLSRRNKLPSSPTATAVRSSSGLPSATFHGPATVQPESGSDDPSMARQSTMSLAVSLERFECRFSTRSSGGLALDDEAALLSYFDLPLELILGCEDDDETGLPMHAAFMFDSDGIRKSVLKKGHDRAGGRSQGGWANDVVHCAQARPIGLANRAPALGPEEAGAPTQFGRGEFVIWVKNFWSKETLHIGGGSRTARGTKKAMEAPPKRGRL